MTAEHLASVLKEYRYRFADELELHAGLAVALDAAGVTYLREVKLEPFGRIDFLCSRVGVEVKIKEPQRKVLRQLAGYARHEAIDSLVLVTTQYRLRAMPAELNGKPLAVCFIGGAR